METCVDCELQSTYATVAAALPIADGPVGADGERGPARDAYHWANPVTGPRALRLWYRCCGIGTGWAA